MSRVGKSPITVPQGTEVALGENNTIIVKGPKGELKTTFHADMIIKMEENILTVERPSDSKEHKSFHGLTRALLNNMVVGVTARFQKGIRIGRGRLSCQ